MQHCLHAVQLQSTSFIYLYSILAFDCFQFRVSKDPCKAAKHETTFNEQKPKSHLKSEPGNEKFLFKMRLYVMGTVTIGIWSLLLWNHYHGGVPSHHILAREDLPAISNWWGGFLLPLLTWFLLYRIQKRLMRNNTEGLKGSQIGLNIFYGFTVALCFGIILSAFFTFGNTDFPGYMLIGLLLLALFLPVFRAECLLGFVIGMTYTFGAVLPTIIGSLFALIGALLFLLVRPAILYVASGFLRMVSSNKRKSGR